ncbi:hypothetical protein FHS26_004445 [Rhizobium pisi]|uniref:Uncharacterized protein n=1 Tax=Rhizobium pisi TaxID=574561 RepID=A0A7W5BQ79_9HYPH|nr:MULTISPECIES: hypothetical protein [Rhizobium]MBB3136688.1 hypothetical protein [Rhizobium pisi]MBY5531397.1 hypothetical protein [Rhizobium leguminosarum]NEH57736.1 hypothetical protein [Rhizobium leguminosarum]NEJ15603.1 hypothetical protein [Rhizobium ruizarguesonis]NEK29678.1 hypothetical protein [Rhizobium ruizarguesonis]
MSDNAFPFLLMLGVWPKWEQSSGGWPMVVEVDTLIIFVRFSTHLRLVTAFGSKPAQRFGDGAKEIV